MSNFDINKEIQLRIREYMARYESFPSQNIIEQWAEECINNYTGISKFEGYSPDEIDAVTYDLWSSKSPVKMKKVSENDLGFIPLFCQVKFIADILLSEGNIKLTATKALPPKIVKEVYKLGTGECLIDNGISKLTKEADSHTVELAHIMLLAMRVVKEQKGVMSLTKNGAKIAEDSISLFEELLRSFTRRFNFAYFDGYANESIGGTTCGFSFILLSKYGNQKHSYNFYAEKIFNAFPYLLKGFNPQYCSIEAEGARCYSHRIFKMFLLQFGLIEIEETGILDYNIKKTPLFDKIIQISLPQNN